MITIYNTNKEAGQEVTGDSAVLHPPVYTLLCKDSADNPFEIETDKETFKQVTDFLDKLASV